MSGLPACTMQAGMYMTPGPTNICKTPAPPAPPIPMPYPSMQQCMMFNPSGCTMKVKILYFPVIIMNSEGTISSGDEPGVAGGVISNVNMGAAKSFLGSFRVMFEGKGVVYLTCLGGMNGTPPNMPAGMQQTPSQAQVMTGP